MTAPLDRFTAARVCFSWRWSYCARVSGLSQRGRHPSPAMPVDENADNDDPDD
jgi:hypothetical protein